MDCTRCNIHSEPVVSSTVFENVRVKGPGAVIAKPAENIHAGVILFACIREM